MSTAANRDCGGIAVSGCKGVQRSEQQLDVREAGSAVRIGHEKSAAAGVKHTVTHSAALPAVALKLHDADVRIWVVFSRELEHRGCGAVGGAIIYDKDLKGAFGERCEVLEGGREHWRKALGFVVCRYDNTEVQRGSVMGGWELAQCFGVFGNAIVFL